MNNIETYFLLQEYYRKVNRDLFTYETEKKRRYTKK